MCVRAGADVTNDTKQRMVEAAAALLQTRGLAATSFTDVIEASGAARGAIYHHFPGGKTELARDAVAWTGRRVRAEFAAIDAQEADAVVAAFLALVRPVAARAAEGMSCAVAAVTVESAQLDPQLTDAVGDVLKSWVSELESQLRRTGASEAASRTVATLMITFLEGAQVLCRAAGNLSACGLSARDLGCADPAAPVGGATRIMPPTGQCAWTLGVMMFR